MATYPTPYEQGGIVGPNQKAMLAQLGGTAQPATAPPLQAPGAPAPMPTSYTPPAAGDLSAGFGENHAGVAGAGKGAMAGVQYGKYVAGMGAIPAAGIGALAGWAKSRTNNTKNDREDFAGSLGLPNSTALWSKLNDSADPVAAGELQNRALNRIGKHDSTANNQWMQDVQAALAAGKPPPAAGNEGGPLTVAPPSSAPPAIWDEKGPSSGGGKNVGIGDVMPFLRANYGHTPQDLQRAFQEHPEMFGGASIIGSKGDKIQFADGKVYDVIQSAGTGGTGWQELWDNDPNAPQEPQGGGMPMQTPGGLGGQLGGDPMAAIQAALSQYGGGSNIQALLKQMQG